MKASVHPVVFDFAFEAGTSRGILKQKTSWFIKLEGNGIIGWGECSPIEGLSPEPFAIINEKIKTVIDEWVKCPEAILSEDSRWVDELSMWPSLRFALETAYLDFVNGGRRLIFNTPFFNGQQAIPINGLVWMNTLEHMQAQLEAKLKQGFKCIKLKIGHHNFQEEFKLLQHLRSRFSKDELTIRVDANGAYTEGNVFYVLENLASIGVHSIEQPIKAGQLNLLSKLCKESPLPIALDEELIKPFTADEKSNLLSLLKPHYIVLKPSLHGGIMGCREWIAHAEQQNISWWMTSYLETSIGLNSIAQFVSTFPNLSYQGLGTGSLYTRTIGSPLAVKQGALIYNIDKIWEAPV